MPQGRISKRSVDSLSCAAGHDRAFLWDDALSGFGVAAFPTGRKVYYAQYRRHGRSRRIALGEHGRLTPDQARSEAKKLLGLVETGADPIAQRREDASAVNLDAARLAARQHAARVTQGANPSAERSAKASAPSVLDVVEGYLQHAKARQRPRSYAETERHLRKHAAPLHYDRADAVRRPQVAALLDRVSVTSGPFAANRLRAALSALWTWGMRAGLIESETSPVTFTPRHPEQTRERVLSDDEIRAIWAATNDSGDYLRIVRLCALTGCRREEIGGLRWAEVLPDRLLIGAVRMKAGSDHEVPLLPAIAAILPSRPEDAAGGVFGRKGTGFSGWSKSKQALDRKLAEAGMPIPRWTLHDLRRTFSTRLHDAGVEPLVIEALLAHKQQGVAAIYNRASFRDAKRAALGKWHQIFFDLVRTIETERTILKYIEPKQNQPIYPPKPLI
jgi:integrase